MANEKMVDKIAKLLAKAEGTTNEHEAATFMAAAQRLMLEHAIEEGMLAKADPARRTRPIVRTMEFGKNVAGIKALRLLLAGVAQTNRCNCWMSSDRRYMSVAGFEEDVEFVLMLTNSIRVQMATALVTAAKEPFAQALGAKTFAVNFMFGYVNRAVTRLRAMQRSVVEEVVGKNFLPVLASRKAEVEAVTPSKLRKGPPLRNRQNGAAMGMGAAAANNADLTGGRNKLGGRMEVGR
jgi:uncharacterized protein DUF2786